MKLINADELKTAFPCGEYVRTESVRATIDHMPSVEPKTGEWIEVKNQYGVKVICCSKCGESAPYEEVSDDYYGYHTHGEFIKTRYCPNCGARMER